MKGKIALTFSTQCFVFEGMLKWFAICNGGELREGHGELDEDMGSYLCQETVIYAQELKDNPSLID